MKKSSHRIGVLSTLTAPLLPRLMQKLFNKGLTDISVILDSKLLSHKDLNIWLERTASTFEGGPSLYDFSFQGLTLYPVQSHNGEDCYELVQKLGLSMLINGGTPRKLNSRILGSVPRGIINVHPGVLPKYRGASCVEWAIYNNEPVGNTSHFMTEGYDEGPIIQTETYEFSTDDTYVSIRSHVYRESLRLMADTVMRVLEHRMSPLDGKSQGDGEQFKPIPDDKMQEVLFKVASKTYPYMKKVLL